MERLRRAVRDAVGYESRAYRLASRSLAAFETVRREGARTALAIDRLQRGAPAATARPLRLRSLAHPFEVRSGTPDITSVVNNVIREEYGRSWEGPAPTTMIDAGAYIGDTTAYFLSRFPGLHCVALEPDGRNLQLAARNLAPYGRRARLLHAGLFEHCGRLRFSGEHDGVAIAETGVEVQALDVPAVLDIAGWERLDLLKMDIEGAEAVVLGAGADAWLPRVGTVIMEPHGSEIESHVRATLRRNGFRVARYRSILFCVRGAA